MTDKFKASVRVLRSYDYCHFECQLGSDETLTLDEINEMRKHAALLCDEAVRQYRIAKAAEKSRESKEWDFEMKQNRIKYLKSKPETELSPEELADLRNAASAEFWQGVHDDDYYYEDQAERDFHFSMLRRFKEHTVKA